MTQRRTFLKSAAALVAGGLLLALPGCGVAGEQLPDYRYRLTVEVDTPEGLKTGSSVIAVKTGIAGRNAIPTPGVIQRRARGEAVTVDLGPRGLLFALLRSDDNSDWASGVMFGFAPDLPMPKDESGKGDATAHTRARFMGMLQKRELIVLPERFKGSKYAEGSHARPMLVRFGDIADPKTVERVDPDKLSASFGKGVTLRRITVQLTDDPVTTGIEKRLAWLPRVYEVLRGNEFHPEGIPVGNFQGLFSTEEFK